MRANRAQLCVVWIMWPWARRVGRRKRESGTTHVFIQGFMFMFGQRQVRYGNALALDTRVVR
jgi:hypothetical protein